MPNRIFRILLYVVSIIFVIMMAYGWIMKDMTSLTKGESLLLYATGSVVIMSWFFLSVMGKKQK